MSVGVGFELHVRLSDPSASKPMKSLCRYRLRKRRIMERSLVIVRISKKLKKHWIAKHEKNGLDEWRLASFVKSQYFLRGYDRLSGDTLLFKFRFQKKGGHPMRATLWAREKKINGGIIELIMFRGHVETLER